MSRFAAVSGKPAAMPPALAYAIFDGLFQQSLLKHLSGNPDAIPTLKDSARHVLNHIFAP
jgi:hypothetical protein